MKAADAVDLIDGMDYKPGHLIVAAETGEYELSVIMAFVSWNSTPGPDGVSSEVMPFLTPQMKISTRPLDETGVLAAVLNGIIAHEIHEAREFFRHGSGTRRAPFHPHNRSSQAAWERTRAIPVTVEYPAPNGE